MTETTKALKTALETLAWELAAAERTGDCVKIIHLMNVRASLTKAYNLARA